MQELTRQLAEQIKQSINEGRLTRLYLLARLRDREPSGAIDLGEGLQLPALGRPFQLEAVRLQCRRIERALDCVGGDALAAPLHELAETGNLGRPVDGKATKLFAKFA